MHSSIIYSSNKTGKTVIIKESREKTVLAVAVPQSSQDTSWDKISTDQNTLHPLSKWITATASGESRLYLFWMWKCCIK